MAATTFILDPYYYDTGTDATSSWTSASNAWDATTTTYASKTIVHKADDSANYLKVTDLAASIVTYGDINKVEMAVRQRASSSNYIRSYTIPLFGGSTAGSNYTTQWVTNIAATYYYDITSDAAGPGSGNWTWSDIENLDIKYYGYNNSTTTDYTLECYEIFLRITVDVELINFSGGSSNGWTNGTNAWDNDTGTYATRTIPANGADDSANYLNPTSMGAQTDLGNINHVYVRIYSRNTSGSAAEYLKVIPVFGGTTAGDTFSLLVPTTLGYTNQDITTGTNAPGTWSWSNVENLDLNTWGYNTHTSTQVMRIYEIYLVIFYESPVPSVSPSGSPSVSPSGTPSVSPSGTPSASPSGGVTTPSVSPSATPSVSPSGTPSVSPSGTPSVSPSVSPSGTPSVSPSGTPSVSPSISPSVSPSVSPSGTPSVSPSGTPSVSPSVSPSISPSVSPSGTPSVSPSGTPSVSPSGTPSVSPSGTPSVSPSVSPSISPSVSPSISPSVSPSGTPSVSPSVSPSGTPSVSPSFSPSVSPSISPSVSPSISPSVSPSISPSVSPSASPSGASVSPSASPSESPSVSPSVSPSPSPIGGMWTVNQTCTPAVTKTSASITILRLFSIKVPLTGKSNRKRYEVRGINKPVIVTQRADALPLVVYSRPDALPLKIHLRQALVSVYYLLKIVIAQTVTNTIESLVSIWTIAKNWTQTCTPTAVTTNAAVTISQSIANTVTGLDVDNDQDTSDGTSTTSAAGAASAITISRTNSNTVTLGTEYTTAVA